MKKETKRKTKKQSIKNSSTQIRTSNLDDLGLEPPKIYRKSQEAIIDNQERRSNNSSKKSSKSKSSDNLTRGERRARETKKRKQKNTFRKIMIWVMIVVLLLAIGSVLSLTVFFHINKVTVSGSSVYTKDEIIAQCPIDVGENLFMSDTDKAKKQIEENLPYVYTAEIKRKLPDTIEIKITDAQVAYSVKQKDKTYILLDDNFKVLELGAQTKEGITISKAKIKSSKLGQTIEFKDADVGDCLKQLADCIQENSFTEITSIYSNNISDNYVVYDGRITFKLGNCNNLETKIYQGLTACEELNSSSPNVEGTMTITGDKSIYFTEK